MTVAVNVQGDGAMKPSFRGNITTHRSIHCPEVSIEKSDDNKYKRPDKLIIGLWYGLSLPIYSSGVGADFYYPYIYRHNYTANGSRIGDTSLSWSGQDGLLERYHKPYKAWIERDKRVVKADILLTNLDLHNFDLSRKVHIQGRNFFIKELSITLTPHTIEPAEVEFVEE